MDLSSLIRQMELAAESLASESAESSLAAISQDIDRVKLLNAARHIISALERPEDTVMNIAKAVNSPHTRCCLGIAGLSWDQPVGQAALKSALQMKIFEAFEIGTTRTARELAVRTGAEHSLVGMCI